MCAQCSGARIELAGFAHALQLPGSRLVLLGVANAIDLTARALPRLAALAVKPVLVPFPAYSCAQLEALLTQRLAALPGPVLAPQALRLLAKKVRRQLLCRAPLLACDLSSMTTRT